MRKFTRPSLARRAASPLALALLLAVSSLASASPEKAAKFYEDALRRYELGDLDSATIQLKNTVQEDRKMLAAHLLLGKVLLAKGQFGAAQVAFEEALKQGISRSEVVISLGQLYLITGDRKKLLDEITLRGMPVSIHADILTLRGAAHAGLGNTIEASKSFAEARALKPQLAAPWIAEAPMLMRMGDGEKARAAAKKAVELEPTNASAWYTLGSVLYGLNDAKGALAAHERALAINEKQVDSRVARASLMLGLGRDKDAEKDIDLLRSWGAVDPRASYIRSLVASRRGDTNAAKAAMVEAAELVDGQRPSALVGNDPLLMTGALAHRALGNDEKAKGYLETLLALNPRHFAAQLLLGSILIDAKEYGRATTLLEAAQRAAPDEPQVLMLLGGLQMARKRYQQASELFERAASRSSSPDALRELAFSQMGLGKDKIGLANLEKAYAISPADTRAAVQLAMTYVNQGNMNQALKTAEAVVRLDSGNLTMLNFLGNIQGRTGDKKAARQSFQQVLAKDPNFRPAAVNLSWLDIEEKRFDDARARLKVWLGRHKNDPDLLFQLGVLEVRAGRFAVAQEQLQLANEMQRNDPRPGLALIELQLAQQQADKAVATGRALSARFQNKTAVQLALGRAYLATGNNTNARSMFSEATRSSEFDATQQVHIGRLQLLAGNPEGAAYNAQKALQASPEDLNALILQVEVETQRGDAARLESALKVLNAKHANSIPTLLTNGNVFMLRRQYPAAQAAYRQALEKAPSTGHALLLARSLSVGGEPDKALTLLEAQAKKQPGDLDLLRATAELQQAAGKIEAASKSFAQLLAANPKDAATMSNYALTLQRMGDSRALGTAEQALQLAPTSPGAIDTLGWVLAQQGKSDAALRHLRDARLRDPSSGNIRFHLAYALAKSGRKAEAKTELAAALNAPIRPSAQPELQTLKLEFGL